MGQPLPESQCHTAVPGDECFHHTSWAMKAGTQIFPAWYPAPLLKDEARFEDFQAWMHQIHHGSCHQPCMTSEGSTPATREPENPVPTPALDDDDDDEMAPAPTDA